MGLSPFSSGFSYTVESVTSPNPNKYRFKIKKIVEGKFYDVVHVNYPDCTTFNGNKLLLVKKGSVTKSTKELDPHFFAYGSVIARFKPNKSGFKMASILKDRKD